MRYQLATASGYLASLALGVLLVWSASWKLADVQLLTLQLQAYQIIPPSLVEPAAFVLAVVELTIGVGLLVGIKRPYPAALGGILLLSFAIAMAMALARGLAIPCGCFPSPELVSPLTLVRTGVLMVVAAVSCRYDRAPLGSGRLLASVLLCFVAVTLSLGPGEPTSLAVQEVEKRFDVQCLVDLDTGKPAVPGQVMGDHGLLLVLLHPDCPACERSLLMLPVLEERLAESGIRVVAAWAAAVEDVIGIPEYYCPAKCLPDVVVGRFPLLVMIDPTGEMSLAVFTELTPSTIVQLEEVIQSRIPKAIDSRK